MEIIVESSSCPEIQQNPINHGATEVTEKCVLVFVGWIEGQPMEIIEESSSCPEIQQNPMNHGAAEVTEKSFLGFVDTVLDVKWQKRI